MQSYFHLFLLFLLQTDKLQTNRDTVFFRDGVRRVDFVLSYVDDKDGEKKQVTRRREATTWIPISQGRNSCGDQESHYYKLNL